MLDRCDNTIGHPVVGKAQMLMLRNRREPASMYAHTTGTCNALNILSALWDSSPLDSEARVS